MLKKTLRALDRSLLFIEEWSLFLSVLLALSVAFANVVLRKTTDLNLYWSDEIVRKVIYFSTFIGCSAAIRSRSLIRVDALPQLLPFLRRGLDWLNHLAVLLFSGIIIKLGWGLTLRMYQDEYARTSTLNIPEWWFYAVLPVMGMMMLVRTLLLLADDVAGGNLLGKG
jgi:TRAP-type C4-dicarboxylate transport system permease small subunit